MSARASRNRRRWPLLAGGGVFLLVALAVTLIADGGGRKPVREAAPDTTSSSAAETMDPRSAVFPFAEDDLRFDDPVEAARFYVVGILGFVDPRVGEFLPGDNRSGEVAVRPREGGAETTVFVRRLDDESWWVIGALGDGIEVDEPPAVASSPLVVRGRATGLEGTLSIELWTDGAEEPLAMGSVRLDGGERRPFETSLVFDHQPSTDGGALIVRSYGGPQGSVQQASVARVRFR